MTRYQVTHLADIRAIPPPSRPTAIFGVGTALGYGHLVRCHRLARAFQALTDFDTYAVGAHPSFALDSPPAAIHEVDLPGACLVDSPEPPEDLPRAEGLRGLTSSMSLAELIAHKSRLLLGLARHLAPRVIVVEHFPFHADLERDLECEAALAHLRDAMPGTLRCAGYRGVSTMRGGEAAFERRRRLLEEYVELLFVYIDPRERSAFFDAHPFLRPLEAKLRFTGYVAPPPNDVARPDVTGSRILAMFGSGLDAYRTIRLVCDAFRLLAATRPDLTLDVVTGGGLPDRAFEEIVAAYGSFSRLRITRFVPALTTHLAEYDLVISRGGYNACVELYCARTRSIVLPRLPLNRPAEQVEEARKFHGYGGIDRIVDTRTASPRDLAGLMGAVLAGSPAPRQALALGGAGTTAAVLDAELRQRAPSLSPERLP